MTECRDSVCDLSVYNPFHFPEGHQLVVLKSYNGYFDGSGKSGDPRCQFLTLAAYAAPPEVWPAFELKWRSILAKHGEQWIHMKEERFRNNPVLVAELLEAVGLASHFGMRTVAATVDLTAHRSLSLSGLPEPGRICAEFCINELVEGASSLSCFFDHGEEFYREVDRCWKREHAGADPWPQLAKVCELGQVRDQRQFPGIQAADLLAWNINRSLTKCDHDIDLALAANRAPGVFKLFDVTALYSLK